MSDQYFKSLEGHLIVLLIFLCPESIMETCLHILTFESVFEILWCGHSNETFSAVLLHGTVNLFFNILQNEI